LHTRKQCPKRILENDAVHLPFEVLAEVVYVLDRVYAVPRPEISASLRNLLRYPNVSTIDAEVALRALETYSASSLDIVDSLLCGYSSVQGAEVVSFDRQLNRYLRTS